MDGGVGGGGGRGVQEETVAGGVGEEEDCEADQQNCEGYDEWVFSFFDECDGHFQKREKRERGTELES